MDRTSDERRSGKPFLEVESLNGPDLLGLHTWLLATLRRSDLSTEGEMHVALRIALEAVRREQRHRGIQLTLT
jgi:hypothetical protein